MTPPRLSGASERELPEGGYCFDCRIAFDDEKKADIHYAMTGHQIGWPFEDVDWPPATDDQIYLREFGPHQ